MPPATSDHDNSGNSNQCSGKTINAPIVSSESELDDSDQPTSRCLKYPKLGFSSNEGSPQSNSAIRLYKAKLRLLKKPWAGSIRVLNEILYHPGPFLAGYLGFPDTKALKHFLFEGPTALGPITEWLEQRKDTALLNTNFSFAHLYDIFSDPTSCSSADLDMGLPRPSTSSKLEHGYMLWIVTMWQILQTDEIDWATLPTFGSPALGGVYLEHWNRAFWILRSFGRAKLGRRVARTPLEYHPNKPAIAPDYLSDSELAAKDHPERIEKPKELLSVSFGKLGISSKTKTPKRSSMSTVLQSPLSKKRKRAYITLSDSDEETLTGNKRLEVLSKAYHGACDIAEDLVKELSKHNKETAQRMADALNENYDKHSWAS